MPTPPLDPAKAEAIRELLAKGLTHVEIARTLNVGTGTVSKVRRQAEAGPGLHLERPDWDKARSLLRKGQFPVEAVARAARATVEDTLDWLEAERATGVNVLDLGGLWTISGTLAYGGETVRIVSRDDNTFSFGCATDQHLGSKYARVDCLHWLYDRFEDEGVQAVMNCGNWIDGEASFNLYDLAVHGMDPQLDYLVENYPHRPGIVTYAIAGNDHEGWYAKKFGIDIGRHAEERFRRHGREDWRHIGYIEGRVELINARTGKSCQLMLLHPGGGSAYALSYQPQKIVESLEGGTKPAILLIGHYHKQSFERIRNVYTVQCGTTQEQTPFMRQKRLEAHVGGALVEAVQDPDTGAILSCKVELIGYFDKGYHGGNRWNYAGPVTHPVRA